MQGTAPQEPAVGLLPVTAIVLPAEGHGARHVGRKEFFVLLHLLQDRKILREVTR